MAALLTLLALLLGAALYLYAKDLAEGMGWRPALVDALGPDPLPAAALL